STANAFATSGESAAMGATLANFVTNTTQAVTQGSGVTQSAATNSLAATAGGNSVAAGGAAMGVIFPGVGADGFIRAQLVWNVAADLDLHLLLPTGTCTTCHVYYGSTNVNFNGGAANARLNADTTGGVTV